MSVVFGWKTYGPDTGLSLSDWLSEFLSVGSLPYATEEHIFIDDPIMRVRLLYEDLQGNVFMSITGDNSNASFEVEDVKFMPAAGSLPSRIRFYITFNCETDAGPLQGHVVSSMAID